jgi:hypothetical protein
MDLEKLKKQLRNLRQNKDLSEEDLELLAKEQLERQEILAKLTFCVNDEERKFASNLLESYLNESSLESAAEKDTLRQLIDIEIVLERIKKFLNVEYQKANSAIPTQMLDQLTTLNNQAIELKEKLGLVSKEKQENSLTEYLNILTKKAIKYYEEHKGCNVVKCPYCQKFFTLLMRTEHLVAKESNMFKGTIYYNKPLLELYHNKVLTIEKVAEILEVSSYYITEIYNNIYLKELKEEKNAI